MYLSDAYGALVDDDAHAPRARSAYARATCDTHTAPTADAPDQICIVRAEDMAPGQPLRSRHDADAWPRPRRQPPLGRLLPYGASPPSLLLPASRTPRRPTPPLSRTHSQRSLASSPRSSPGVAVGTRSVSVVTPTFNKHLHSTNNKTTDYMEFSVLTSAVQTAQLGTRRSRCRRQPSRTGTWKRRAAAR